MLLIANVTNMFQRVSRSNCNQTKFIMLLRENATNVFQQTTGRTCNQCSYMLLRRNTNIISSRLLIANVPQFIHVRLQKSMCPITLNISVCFILLLTAPPMSKCLFLRTDSWHLLPTLPAQKIYCEYDAHYIIYGQYI